MNFELAETFNYLNEKLEAFNTLSEKRKEVLIVIACLLVATILIHIINKCCIKRKALSTICIASYFIGISFAIPIALNLSFQKDGPGPVILQSFITISGGMVVLLGYIENRRKNDIDELKNADEKIQRIQSSRYEKSIKSIELLPPRIHFLQFLQSTTYADSQMSGLMNGSILQVKPIAKANKRLKQL